MNRRLRTAGRGVPLWRVPILPTLAVIAGALFPAAMPAWTEPIQLQLASFTLTNQNADGKVQIGTDGLSFVLTGGNTGSGIPGVTTFAGFAPASGDLSFSYSYSSLDVPGYDSASYFVDRALTELAYSDGTSGGDTFGWSINTADNTGEPVILSVSLAATPSPELAPVTLLLLGITFVFLLRRRSGWKPGKPCLAGAPLMMLLAAFATNIKCECQDTRGCCTARTGFRQAARGNQFRLEHPNTAPDIHHNAGIDGVGYRFHASVL